MQIRVMEKTKPPIRIVSLGRVYRPDDMDDTQNVWGNFEIPDEIAEQL